MKVEAHRRLMQAEELADRAKRSANSGEPEVAMAILADSIKNLIDAISIELTPGGE